MSPHARALPIGPMTLYPMSSSMTLSCLLVSGCSHMNVFMAGNRYVGVEGERARRSEVARLSQMPPAILARVLAEQGAIKTTSAHRRSCRAGQGGRMTGKGGKRG